MLPTREPDIEINESSESCPSPSDIHQKYEDACVRELTLGGCQKEDRKSEKLA
jgi:hypothetical protein